MILSGPRFSVYVAQSFKMTSDETQTIKAENRRTVSISAFDFVVYFTFAVKIIFWWEGAFFFLSVLFFFFILFYTGPVILQQHLKGEVCVCIFVCLFNNFFLTIWSLVQAWTRVHNNWWQMLNEDEVVAVSHYVVTTVHSSGWKRW